MVLSRRSSSDSETLVSSLNVGLQSFKKGGNSAAPDFLSSCTVPDAEGGLSVLLSLGAHYGQQLDDRRNQVLVLAIVAPLCHPCISAALPLPSSMLAVSQGFCTPLCTPSLDIVFTVRCSLAQAFPMLAFFAFLLGPVDTDTVDDMCALVCAYVCA